MDLAPKDVPPFKHWLKHKDSFGLVSSVKVMGQTIIICHDREAANQLLNKNSAQTSGRPKMGYAQKLCGFGNITTVQQYDKVHRHHRKIMNQQLGTRVLVAQFNGVQELEARRLLLRILRAQNEWTQHVHTMVAAIMLTMTYGYSIAPYKVDRLVEKVEQSVDDFMTAFLPMSWPTDFIPTLEHLPEGFPGTGFRERARQYAKNINEVADTTYAFVKQQMKNRSNRPSFVSKLLQENGDEADEDLIKWVAATLYGGGSDTTVTSVCGFIHAMINFPEVQQKAQAEIDAIVGPERFPRLQDRDKMPYIEALVKEVYRWSPVAPMGIPHSLEQDVVFGDYLLPKGAHILPAMWWFCNDGAVYTDPESFCPERYMEPRNEPDPLDFVFGYGRRTCPGRYFAEAGVWIAVTSLLTVFRIAKAVDAQGREIEAKLERSTSLTGKLKIFACRFVPRSARHEEMICAVETEHPWEESDGGLLNWAED
ncbi:hypothetical protein CDD82_6469 [Ophiocordyceps australis]|uniref:Cytochrome P450 n=1 Tax=Ophiocordyceps australis TaxID=1399860 RepID=A0A2C5Y327_9HYPO|nr:hypothetical protein CDD82_6469 [Ophiocordyceps australis]